MSPRRRSLLLPLPLALAAAAAGSCALIGSGRDPAAVPARLRAEGARYLGSAACRECHVDLYEGWRRTRHPFMEQVAGPDSVVAPFDGAPFQVDGVEMRAWRDADRYLVRTLGPDGEMHDYPVARTIGGFFKQRYVTEVDGHDAILPIQWNVGTAHWKPYSSAGHESIGTGRFWASPDNRWETRCAGCHTVGLELLTRADGSLAASQAEFGVGCESCHGPGSLHVARPEAAGLILDPAGLPPELQVDVCGACHSRGQADQARHGAPAALRFPWDFRPGERLLDHYRLDELPAPGQESETYWPDGTSKAHHQQAMDFRRDAHFAAAGMVCTSCHDPHDRAHPAETRLPARDDTLCLSCHSWSQDRIVDHTHHDADSTGSTCIACHMPKVVHHAEKLQLRSHTRGSPDPAAAARLGQPDACTLCHADRDQAWAAEWAGRWWGGPGK